MQLKKNQMLAFELFIELKEFRLQQCSLISKQGIQIVCYIKTKPS
jgi:hypothetical protein